MNLVKIKCAFCGKEYFRPKERVNEAKKYGWKQYCSKKCQIKSKMNGVKRKCGNPSCNKLVYRSLKELKKSKSGKVFCSSSCAAIFNNSSKRKIKICPVCNKKFFGGQKYCSNICRAKALQSKPKSIKISKVQIINEIKNFYKLNGRIPFKKEYAHYNTARDQFGTWNKAIEAAGFNSNPIKFSKKWIANDGHSCDSLAEKVIDDWLYKNKIKHKRNISYPENKKLTVDFVTKNSWIEFFGLAGELEEYDKIIK